MKHKKIFSVAIIALLTAALTGTGLYLMYDKDDASSSVTSQNRNQESTQATINEQNCVSEDCLEIDNLEYPVGTLPDSVVNALNLAINDEYLAHATYESVIEKIGSLRPFSMIIRAEEQHIASLKALYDKYGEPIPDDPYSIIEVSSIKSENCANGVQAEIDNAALYRNELLPVVQDYPDITQVFTSLMNASQDKHLPAFQGCAS